MDIKNMNMGVSKFKKGNNGMVILSCNEDKDFRILKQAVSEKLGNNFEVTEIIPKKPKIKIINIGKDELEMKDKDLLDTIRKQNRIETNIDGFHMRLLKRMKRADEELIILVGHQRKKAP